MNDGTMKRNPVLWVEKKNSHFVSKLLFHVALFCSLSPGSNEKFCKKLYTVITLHFSTLQQDHNLKFHLEICYISFSSQNKRMKQ